MFAGKEAANSTGDPVAASNTSHLQSNTCAIQLISWHDDDDEVYKECIKKSIGCQCLASSCMTHMCTYIHTYNAVYM